MALNTAFVKSPLGITLILATVLALISFALFESPAGVAGAPKPGKVAFYEFATAASWVISFVLIVTVVLGVWEGCAAGNQLYIFMGLNGILWGLLLVIAGAMLLDELALGAGILAMLDIWIASGAIAILAALMFFIHAFLALRNSQKSSPAQPASPITTAHFTGR